MQPPMGRPRTIRTIERALSALTDDQYRTGRRTGHAGRVGAEDRQIEGAAPVHTHDDQVGMLGRGHFQNLPVCRAFPHGRFHPAVGPRLLGNQRPEPLEGGRLGGGPDAVDVEVLGQRVLTKLRRHFDHMEHGQARIGFFGHRRRVPQGVK